MYVKRTFVFCRMDSGDDVIYVETIPPITHTSSFQSRQLLIKIEKQEKALNLALTNVDLCTRRIVQLSAQNEKLYLALRSTNKRLDEQKLLARGLQSKCDRFCARFCSHISPQLLLEQSSFMTYDEAKLKLRKHFTYISNNCENNK